MVDLKCFNVNLVNKDETRDYLDVMVLVEHKSRVAKFNLKTRIT